MSSFNSPLSEVDPEIAAALEQDLGRQRGTLEMIASENFVPRAVLEAQGSVLTNKYAEGYPGRRYYGGCEFVDVAESLAIARAKSLFGSAYANVQPHSGATANAAVLAAIASPGDRILGLALDQGGHLTHGMKLNFSGKLYEANAYGVDPTTNLIDMDVVRERALEVKPQVLIAGWSAYPRQLDFAAFRAIADEVGAMLWVDMAHFAGLVAAGLHPTPVPHAHVTSSTVHKTIGGPRSGFILTNDLELQKKLNSNVFPGQQGGPLMHVIAAKATAFKLAGEPEFKERQERTIRGAQILAERLTAADSKAAGIDVLTGGTDVHLVLVDLRKSEIHGQDAEDILHALGHELPGQGLAAGHLHAVPSRRVAPKSLTKSRIWVMVVLVIDKVKHLHESTAPRRRHPRPALLPSAARRLVRHPPGLPDLRAAARHHRRG
ncbi:MAG: serine hydroxymethyltransferase, partial [Rhodoglobus sp.]